jgi:ribulose-5-phosphate 4-epimerase/fuculose-1-phosphate aldolase
LLLISGFEGNVIAGDGVPEATAFFIHARVHKMAPRVGAAFHTHMPNATALSMLQGEPLVWAGQTALKFYGRVAIDGTIMVLPWMKAKETGLPPCSATRISCS